MVRAGEMRHQIRIEVRASSQDASGQPLSTWQTFASVRAALQRTPGREIVASAREEGRLPTVFLIRYLAGVKSGMRVIWEGRVYQLTSPPVDPGGRHEQLTLITEEWEGREP